MEVFEQCAEEILHDYQKGRDIDQAKGYHPDREAVADLVKKLLGLIYPGYFPQDTPVIVLMAQMETQIALLGQNSAEKTTLEFFRRIPGLRAAIQSDVEAAYEGDPAATSMDEVIFCYPGLFAITVYRLAHGLHVLGVPMLPRIMTEYAHSLTGIDIHPGAQIGQQFFIDHGTGIVIGETTIIGDQVKIYQGVTLGGLSTRGGQSLRGKKRHPTIEDRVTIYANASILGGDTRIGRDSVIGANAFITSSVPPCTTVTNQDQELLLRPRFCEGCPVAEFRAEK